MFAIERTKEAKKEHADVFRLHDQLERNSALRRSYLKKLPDNSLRCKICNFSRPFLQRSLHEAHFELHFSVPNYTFIHEMNSVEQHLELLCASCHRCVHTLMLQKCAPVTILEAKTRLLGQMQHRERIEMGEVLQRNSSPKFQSTRVAKIPAFVSSRNSKAVSNVKKKRSIRY